MYWERDLMRRGDSRLALARSIATDDKDMGLTLQRLGSGRDVCWVDRRGRPAGVPTVHSVRSLGKCKCGSNANTEESCLRLLAVVLAAIATPMFRFW
eukprot:scaffold55618_cov40-Tisochrysis_lutea.AAC.1